jgi:hypothetical protein
MNLNATMQLNEKLDWISKGETLEEQVMRTKQVAQMDSTFALFMRMATVESERITGLPEGMPEVFKPKMDMPDGMSDTTARQELRRIKNFLPNGSMKTVPQLRRETIWLQMLEGMHWKESNIMVHIKDQTLLSIYPNMREVLTQLGTVITVPEATPALKKKKSKTP